jgi:hypothetical protein
MMYDSEMPSSGTVFLPGVASEIRKVILIILMGKSYEFGVEMESCTMIYI